MEVTPDWASWINWKGDPQRVIASLELLGTLVSIMVFSIGAGEEIFRAGTLSGSTDNRGNTFATAKLMSTKYPLTILLMELSEQMRARSTVLHLSWLQRDLNVQADALTNQEYGDFDSSLRVGVVPDKLPWIVLHKLMGSSEDLYKDIIAQKGKAGYEAGSAKAKRTPANKRLRWTDPW